MTVETIGSRIRSRRQEVGLTQVELARIVGLSQATIAQLESGKRQKTRELVAIAKALKASPYYLATGKGTVDATGSEETHQALAISATYMFFEEFSERIFPNNIPGSEAFLSLRLDDPEAHGILIRGDGLLPRIKDGEVVVLSPMFEPKSGDTVLVHFSDGKATIKELASIDKQVLSLRSPNGASRSFPAETVAKLERVALIVTASEVSKG